MDELNKKLDKIQEQLHSIDLTQAVSNNILERLTATVEVHEARSTALEKLVIMHERENDRRFNEQDKEMEMRFDAVDEKLRESNLPILWFKTTIKLAAAAGTVLAALKLAGYL